MTKNKKRILLTRRLHHFALNELRKKYNLHIHSGKIPMPKEELIERIREADGLICFPYDIIDKNVIAAAEKLKVISTYSVGYDHIDIKSAKKKNIRIGYTPIVLTEATADLAFSLILDLLRRVTEGDRIIREGKWRQIYGPYDYVGQDLKGKILGIWGLGRIGRALAIRANGFGMKIVYYNRKRISRKEEKILNVKLVSLSELFRKSDVVSIHVPYTKQTRQKVNMSLLKIMKKSAFIINTARGKIIKESDLISALKEKIIAGAALDVYEKEPIGEKHPLTKMENVVLVPHIGSSSAETRKKMAELTIKNLELGLSRKKMIYSVDC